MKKTKSDEVAEKLERAILGGEFKPGDSLPSQGVLASRFGVGLRAVRSALGILEVKGLVAVDQGRKPVVSDNSLELYMEFLLHSMSGNLRLDEATLANLVGLMGVMAIENGKLAALAPNNRRRRAAGELRRIIDRLRICLEEDFKEPPPPVTNYYRRKKYPTNAEALVHSFHLELASCGGNRILLAVYKALHAILAPRVSSFAYTREEVESEIGRLERVADGIEKGDVGIVLASLIVSLELRSRQCMKRIRQSPLPPDGPLPAGGPLSASSARPAGPALPNSARARKKTKGEIIAQDIEEKILSGKYKAGDLLPTQDELCDLYGASPRSIRDALGRLQARALVDVRQGRRSSVRTSRLDHYIASLSASMRGVLKVDGKLVMDLVQLDSALVISAVGLACGSSSADKAALGKLRSLASAMQGLPTRAEGGGEQAFAEFSALQGRFHRALLALNSNPFLDTIYDHLVSFLEMESDIGLTEYTFDEMRSMAREHRLLVEAIEGKRGYLAVSTAVVIISTIGRKLAEAYGVAWPMGARSVK